MRKMAKLLNLCPASEPAAEYPLAEMRQWVTTYPSLGVAPQHITRV